MKRNEGFGVIGILLIVVLVVVGVAAWRIADMQKPRSKATMSSTATAPQKKTASSQLPPQPAANYLDIQPLGIKLKLDTQTLGISYIAASPVDTGADGVFIIDPTMKTIDNANQDCSGSQAGMIGLLQRSKDSRHWSPSGAPLTIDNMKSFKLDGYYYLFSAPQAECSQDSSIAQQRLQHEQAFIGILSSIQAD